MHPYGAGWGGLDGHTCNNFVVYVFSRVEISLVGTHCMEYVLLQADCTLLICSVWGPLN